MAWNIGEQKYPQLATFWKIQEEQEKFSVVSLGTSSKDKEKNWHNSSWSWCRFVGNANKDLHELKEGDKIVIVSGKIDRDSWVDKDGTKQYPKNEKITIFAWKKYEPSEKEDARDVPPVVEESDDVPF